MLLTTHLARHNSASVAHRLRLFSQYPCRYNSTKACDPLRILFFGSDHFSAVSLKAVHNEQLARPNDIASIDVAHRPGKRVGRGLKILREVPIKKVAEDLGLPVHSVDSFKEWERPVIPYNLIIAVSFGLLIPGSLLESSKYGGLNVHPSLIPEFRGAAPLHHTLLAGRALTGVSLQTLHPTKFDRGVILSQTTPPGIKIPDPHKCTVEQLEGLLASEGAALLVQGIRDKAFVPPLRDRGWNRSNGAPEALLRAPKVTPEDKHIKWRDWTADNVITRERILGDLWTTSDEVSLEGRELKFEKAGLRMILHGFSPIESRDKTRKPGTLRILRDHGASRLVVATKDGNFLEVQEITIQGRRRMDAAQAAGNLFANL